AFRRSSVTRIGPTGTPLIAQYHSSFAEMESSSFAAPASSGSFCTDDLKAPASAPAGCAGARGAVGRAADKLVAKPPARGAAGARAPPACAGGGFDGVLVPSGCGSAEDTLVSVTAARTSI